MTTSHTSTTPQAFICDAIRTPFGRYGGALSSVRTDDLGAIPLRALMARNPNVDWASLNIFVRVAAEIGNWLWSVLLTETTEVPNDFAKRRLSCVFPVPG